MYYYNTENNEGCWEKPEDFSNSSLLTREEIQVSSTCSTRAQIIIPTCFNYCLTFIVVTVSSDFTTLLYLLRLFISCIAQSLWISWMGNMVFPYLMSLGCVWQVICQVCLLHFMVLSQFDNTVLYSLERASPSCLIASKRKWNVTSFIKKNIFFDKTGHTSPKCCLAHQWPRLLFLENFFWLEKSKVI